MGTKYQIWLTSNAEKEKIRLPVLPTSFKTVNRNEPPSPEIFIFQFFSGNEISGNTGGKYNETAFLDSENKFLESWKSPHPFYCNRLWCRPLLYD